MTKEELRSKFEYIYKVDFIFRDDVRDTLVKDAINHISNNLLRDDFTYLNLSTQNDWIWFLEGVYRAPNESFEEAYQKMYSYGTGEFIEGKYVDKMVDRYFRWYEQGSLV